MSSFTEFDTRCVDTIRVLSADVVQKADSGHPGAPMGCAPMAHVLWSNEMTYNPKNPFWTNRDRFILSNGHACALHYVMLHLTGYEQMTMDQLKQFRQLNSITAGHPENHLVDGIEVSTGPLGQGISNAVGIAIAEEHLRSVFNREGFPVVDHYTFVICGDGCLQEGISSEACSLAGHLGLGKLIVLYDDNKITIDGDTSKSFTEDVLKRYEAYGWHTQHVTDGNYDLNAIKVAIDQAKAVTDKPSIIKVSTIIGLGSKIQGTGGVHGSPLGEEDLSNVKKKYKFDPDQKFVVEAETRAFYEKCAARGTEAEAQWNKLFEAYSQAHPDLAKDFLRRKSGELPEGWKSKLPVFTAQDPAKASRQWSQMVLQALVDNVPEVLGGSADLQPSNGTALKNYPPFQKGARNGRYMHFGVREHAMAAICNGMAAYGMNVIPFAATFLNFIEYAYGSVRVCAISRFRVIWVMTHDSIGLGEDGPTHQPVEANALIRSTPNILFLRPGSGNEVTGSYIVALENKHRSSVLALSRQAFPNVEGTSAEKVALGAYTVLDHAEPKLILVGTGSELYLCVEAAKQLQEYNPRVVSMPCMELFEEQSAEYQQTVFPSGVPVVSIEAMSPFGWSKFSHVHVGVNDFGVSAPYKDVYKKFGITLENLVQKSKALVAAFPNNTAPDLNKLRLLNA
eukprot:c21066_g2_i1.p1 GENE.c21066_g2_i1~~c21066_g2_i1.p1  ORF type:complete len:679 (+),score=295.17 c21066_g2_i1:56-2092(+)